MRNPGYGGNPTQQPKMYSFTPPEKFLFMKFTSAIKTVIPSPWNSNFYLITLVSFVAVAMAVVSFFNFILYVNVLC